MAGTIQHEEHATRLMAAAIILSLVLGLAPARFIRWVGAFGDFTQRIIAPIGHPLYQGSHWLTRSGTTPSLDNETQALLRERDQFQTLYFQQTNEIRRLRQLITDLQEGVALNPDLPVIQIAAPVIGRQSDPVSSLLTIRRGSNDGVTPNTVAVVNGIDLLGKVVRTSKNLSYVQPITSKGAGRIQGRIMLGDGSPGLDCTLLPTGTGVLKGLVKAPANPDQSPTIAPGQLVRLADKVWPKNAQMLVLGEVLAVEPAQDLPTRKVITVQPRARLSRVSEVVLRVLKTPEAQKDGGG